MRSPAAGEAILLYKWASGPHAPNSSPSPVETFPKGKFSWPSYVSGVVTAFRVDVLNIAVGEILSKQH